MALSFLAWSVIVIVATLCCCGVVVGCVQETRGRFRSLGPNGDSLTRLEKRRLSRNLSMGALGKARVKAGGTTSPLSPVKESA